MTQLQPVDILKSIGITRVVWVDDNFEHGLEALRDAVLRIPVIVHRSARLTDLRDLVDPDGTVISDAAFEDGLAEILQDSDKTELAEINQAIRDEGAEQENEESEVRSNPSDIKRETAQIVSQILDIRAEDCVGFEKAMDLIGTGAANGNDIAIIVDLQNAVAGSAAAVDAGIGILRSISATNGRQMVFVLTHEAAIDTEAQKEREIFDALEAAERHPCVISKDRIQNGTLEEVAQQLNVALKRAALRREVFELGENSAKAAAEHVRAARNAMCQVPPEELEAVFVKRAVKEGVSDLHLLQRAFSSQASKGIKSIFATDEDSVRRMATLRGIELEIPTTPSENLAEIERMRIDEMWTSGEHLSAISAPLALGDMFETVDAEQLRSFILLGQPCDLMLRGDATRTGDHAQFVSFKRISAEDAEKKKCSQNVVRINIGGDVGILDFDFRHSSPIDLRLLDVCTFSKSGKMTATSDDKPDPRLLQGQAKAFGKIQGKLKLLKKEYGKDKPSFVEALANCRLTFSSEKHFRAVCLPKFDITNDVCKIEWNLHRIGRLHSPHTDELMGKRISLLGRRADDLDYVGQNES